MAHKFSLKEEKKPVDTNHEIVLKEYGYGDGICPALYCETHKLWIVVLEEGHIQISGHSCLNKDGQDISYDDKDIDYLIK